MLNTKVVGFALLASSIAGMPGFAAGVSRGGTGVVAFYNGPSRSVSVSVGGDRAPATANRDLGKLGSPRPDARRRLAPGGWAWAAAPGLPGFGAPSDRFGFYPLHRSVWPWGYGCGPGWGWGFGCYGVYGIVGAIPPPVYYPPLYCGAAPEECNYPEPALDNSAP